MSRESVLENKGLYQKLSAILFAPAEQVLIFQYFRKKIGSLVIEVSIKPHLNSLFIYETFTSACHDKFSVHY